VLPGVVLARRDAIDTTRRYATTGLPHCIRMPSLRNVNTGIEQHLERLPGSAGHGDTGTQALC
jgi:hypothetical protein